jgi:hypothetical protein
MICIITTINKTSIITVIPHPNCNQNENQIIIIGIEDRNIPSTGIIQKMKTMIASVKIYGKVVAQCMNAIKYNQTMVRRVFIQEIRL